jgi:RNA polymerase-binding protein DksA
MSGEKTKKTVKAAGKTATGKVTSKVASKATVGKVAANKAVAGKTTGKTVNKAAGKTTSKPVSKTTKKAENTLSKGTSSRRVVPKVDWPVFIEKMEQSLQEQKSELMANLVANSNDFKEIVEGMDPKDLADVASDDIDRKMIEALGSQELKRLKLIDSALTRIKQGKYGYCIKCDRRIPPDRLEAIPYALMCIECKSEEERRNR